MIGPARSINTGAAVEECGENVLSRETPTPQGLQLNPLVVATSHTRGRGPCGTLGVHFTLTLGGSTNRISKSDLLANHFSVSVAPPCDSNAQRTPQSSHWS